MKLRANPRIPLALLAILLASIPSLGWSGRIECLDRQNWDEKMSVDQYMEDCDAAVISQDGCRLNIEKACINGVEVDFINLRSFQIHWEGMGFYSQASNGVKRSDFVDPSKMYNVSRTPGNRDLTLCSKIDGLSDAEVSNMRIDRLPQGKDFVVESVPAFINPRPDVASLGLHWKVTVRDGKPFIQAEIRGTNNLDESTGGRNKRPDLTKAHGSSFDEIFKQFYLKNLVRCKKGETFFESTRTTAARSLGELSEEYRKSLASSHAKIMKGIANSGLDTAALSRKAQDILRADELQMEEETAPPAQGKPHAKRKSQRQH